MFVSKNHTNEQILCDGGQVCHTVLCSFGRSPHGVTPRHFIVILAVLQDLLRFLGIAIQARMRAATALPESLLCFWFCFLVPFASCTP